MEQNEQSAKRFWVTSALVVAAFSLQSASADGNADLAKQLANPLAALISVPVKVDWNTGIGEADADRTAFLVQPVIPITLNDDWNVISRTILPLYIDAESPVTGGSDFSGTGDISQSFFFSPKAPTESGWIWGAGPVFTLPTASEDALGSGKFSLGPTAVALKQQDGWTYGALVNHLWSIGGDDDRSDVSNTYLQPFLSYTTKKHTTLGANLESSYNWEAEEWTVPLNLTVSQLVKFGKQPVSLQLGYRNYLDAPAGGPDWGLRFQITFMFPK